MLTKNAPNDLIAVEKTIDENHKVYYRTRFNFLRETKGLRRGCAHGFLGNTGSGKTTLLKTVLADTLEDAECLAILTEEPIQQYVTDLRIVKPDLKIKNLKYYHKNQTPDFVKKNAQDLWTHYRDVIVDSGCKVIFWDNPTTSEFYSTKFRVDAQEFLWEQLMPFVEEEKLTLVYTIHTQKGIGEHINRLLDGDDVRGSNQAFQMAHYFYVMQRFQEGNKFYPFLRIRKHRYHKFIDNYFFYLNYVDGHYKSDKAVDFKDINEAFLKRNMLGGGGKKR